MHVLDLCPSPKHHRQSAGRQNSLNEASGLDLSRPLTLCQIEEMEEDDEDEDEDDEGGMFTRSMDFINVSLIALKMCTMPSLRCMGLPRSCTSKGSSMQNLQGSNADIFEGTKGLYVLMSSGKEVLTP